MKNIYRHIGKMLFCVGLPLGSLAGSWTACSDFFDIEPQNFVTLDQFWNEENDVVSSIAGCYAGLNSEQNIRRMMAWGEFRSENVQNRGKIDKDNSLQRVLEEDITPTNAYCDWSFMYNVINRCNIIIHYAPKVHEIDPAYSKGELAAHIAEVTAIRSLCYFYLIRTFRDVPYSEEAFINDAQTMDLPQTDFYVVLHHLINSLESVQGDAVVRYPEEGSSQSAYYQTGRMTQLAIWTMLCEMYLWDKQYDKCIEYADKVIEYKKAYVKEKNRVAVDYSDYYNYPLYSSRYKGTSYYGYSFTQNFAKNNSLESIFEVAYEKGNVNAYHNIPVGLFYGGTDLDGYVQPSEYIKGQVKSSNSTLFNNNKYDGRRYENFLFNSGGEALGINKYVPNYLSGVEVLTPNTANFYSSTSNTWGSPYSVYAKGNDHISENASNWIVYRLSDVMLLKAEALAWTMKDLEEGEEMSEEDKAKRWSIFQLCNAINKRALYQESPRDTLVYDNFKTKGVLLDLVYDEREREFLFEGKRFFDLVRRAMAEGNTDYLRSKASQKSTELASTIDNFMMRMEAIYWPVSLTEMKANPNLKQNPAYGSGEGNIVKN